MASMFSDSESEQSKDAAPEKAKAPKKPKKRRKFVKAKTTDMTEKALTLEPTVTFEDDAISVQASQYDYEKLQVMKAKTMYEMVEEIDVGHGPVKLLFLTNSQADSICSSSYTLKKMLEALEIENPKLVINLVGSRGLRASLNLWPWWKYASDDHAAMKYDAPPFLSLDEEQIAMAKLDQFMTDILLPLAASTHAMILANAVPGECALASALSRSYRLHRAKWGSRPPFVILSVADDLPILYLNPNLDAHWRALRRQSKAWKARDKLIFETMQSAGWLGMKLGQEGSECPMYDLDVDARTILLVDQVTSNQLNFDSKPTNLVRVEVLRFLASTLPSIAVKTGYANKNAMGNTTGFQVCLDQANSGTKLLLLDLRKRSEIKGEVCEAEPKAEAEPKVEAERKTLKMLAGMVVPVVPQREPMTRQRYLEAALEHMKALRKELQIRNLCESLDACAVAYAHHFLFGPMDPTEVMIDSRQAVPLHEAIKRAKSERRNHDEEHSLDAATDTQVMEVAQQLASWALMDALRSLPEERQTQELKDRYWEQASDMLNHIKGLLMHSRVHSVNVHDQDACRRTLDTMVQSDSLPKKNSLEGLLLLREAWSELDVANFLASKYKFQTKSLYFAQLLLAWLVVLSSQMALEGLSFTASDLVFLLTVLSGAVISVESLIKPKPKWQALRRGAFKLESLLWCYRTRVGQFRLGQGIDARMPETLLCQQLNHWSEELLATADLKRSAWNRSFAASVYRHKQHTGELSQPVDLGGDGLAVDDHYSPVHPERYIHFRMMDRMRWYKKRIPMYTLHAFLFKLVLLLCVVSCSILARFEQPVAAVVVTAFASAATTWAEFVNAGSKVERYTRAVRTINELLNWWRNLSEVEKASSESISRLVLETEHAIFSEQASWISSGNSSAKESPKEGEAREDDPAAKQRGKVKAEA